MLPGVPRLEPSKEALTRAVADDPRALRPLWRRIVCDGDTPVRAFAALKARFEPAFLLESVVGGERWARYSFIGVGARAHLQGRFRGRDLEVSFGPGEGFSVPALAEGLTGHAALEAALEAAAARPEPRLPRFWGGWVGVFGHDYVRSVEALPRPTRDGDGDDALPAFELVLPHTLVVFDNLSSEVFVVTALSPRDDGGLDAAYQAGAARIEEVVGVLASGAPLRPLALDDVEARAPSLSPAWRAGHAYQALVREAKSFIERGDIFQVVLSQRFDTPAEEVEMLDVYRALRVTNPAPYMYALELGSATLVGASPEVLVRVDRDDRAVTVRPIAGTRRRGATEEEDLELERELLADPKERAEHLMLIDLGRNDVGRVSEAGSVRPTARFVIERYSKVMHIVSEVTGTLRAGLTPLDALRATFPAGTLSGAPKVRALEIIDALEPAARGWYGGAVGYLGLDGGADFAICIRSAVSHGGVVRVQAGAGVVHDSSPEAEDEECYKKAAAVHVAIDMARATREVTP